MPQISSLSQSGARNGTMLGQYVLTRWNIFMTYERLVAVVAGSGQQTEGLTTTERMDVNAYAKIKDRSPEGRLLLDTR